MHSFLCLFLSSLVSANLDHGIYVADEKLSWPDAYSKCKNMSMNIFNNSADVQRVRECHGIKGHLWINYPINIQHWSVDDISADAVSLDQCLVIDCSRKTINLRPCNEPTRCVCDNKNYYNDHLISAKCSSYCQNNGSLIIQIQSAESFCRRMSQNITLFWGNDRGVLSLNNIRYHICTVSTSQETKQFKSCGEAFPFICVADWFQPCGLRTTSTTSTTYTTSPNRTSSPSTYSTKKQSTSRATTLPSTKSSRWTYSSVPLSSFSNTKTQSPTTVIPITTTANNSNSENEMKTAEGQTGSTTVLVAALVTAVVVVGVLLGVIFCLFRRMRRLTTAEDSKNTQSHSNDENESRPRDLYEDSTARLSQHEYQEIDKVQLFRHNKVNDDDGNIENTYTEIIPDIDTNYVTLENDSSGKRQTGPECISTHNTLDEPDNSQKESTGRVNLSFETDSTYFVLDKI